MRILKNIIIPTLLLFSTVYAVSAGVLATEDDRARGMENLVNPDFIEITKRSDGLAAAVLFFLTENPSLGDSAQTALNKTVASSVNNLPAAQGVFSDSSSLMLYEALVMYDLLSGSDLFALWEHEVFRVSMKSVLDHYLQDDVFPWDEEYLGVGATSLRISASCALFALNFQDDPDSEFYIRHSMKQFDNNLDKAIDDYGSWTADPPGIALHALEYLIVAGKALRNGDVYDYFSHNRLQNVLKYEMALLPSQQSPYNRGVFMIFGEGKTNPSINHGDRVIWAAADIMEHSPYISSNLIWFWEQCGKPATPLGLLYIDTEIPSQSPDSQTSIVGGGKVVMRHNSGAFDESLLYVKFGGVTGIPDPEAAGHSDNGDFSFIWRGIPIVFHDGYSGDECSDNYMNAAAWRHNLVTKRGSGETPVFLETPNPHAAASSTDSTRNTLPADFYSEGINQFLTTVMVDYVSGEIHQAARDMPPSSYIRHFLYIKPDVVLIWDQIESSFPLEWNLWIPADTVAESENSLHLMTPYDVDLEVLFADDRTLEYSADDTIRDITWDWPLIMSAESGLGNVTVSSLDFFTSARYDSTTCSRDLLYNILSPDGEQPAVGLISKKRDSIHTLSSMGISFTLLESDNFNENSLDSFTTLLIDSDVSARGMRILRENSILIDRYIKAGGSVLWLCPSPKDWLSWGNCPDFIPYSMVPGGCPVLLNGMGQNPDTAIKLHDSRLWRTPTLITSKSFGEWLSEYVSNTSAAGIGMSDSLERRIYVPASWSDSWRILASIKAVLPLKSHAGDVYENPSRIRVYHPAGNDYCALLLPRGTGRPNSFKLTNQSPGRIRFKNNTNEWEIQRGGNEWTDANLSLRISNVDGIKGIYAFDCTYVTAGDENFRSDKPFSLFYSPLEGAGVIMTAHTCNLYTSRVDFKLYAGEINFYDFHGDVWTERISYITNLVTVNESGDPVGGVSVHIGGRYCGLTEDNGTLVLRWPEEQRVVDVRYDDFRSSSVLVPGELRVTIPGE